MIYIGIDPGVKTGFAAYDTEFGDFDYHGIRTKSIIEAIEDARAYHNVCGRVTIVMEDARLRKWFKGGREMLQGAGSIKRDCQIWEEFCEYNKIPLIKVPPKDNKTKLSPETFAKITGYTKRTSNHARDAAMLVWGRK